MSWIKDFHNYLNTISDIERELLNLADSFYETGNKVVSTKLYNLGKFLEIATTGLNDIISKKVAEDYKKVEANSKAMLRLALHIGDKNG